MRISSQFFRIPVVITGFICSLFFACSTNIDREEFDKPYFDLAGYFHDQATLLDSINPKVEKTVEKDGVAETKILNNIDWKKELKVFVESDINKPSWQNRYTVDTIVTNEQTLITYRAKEDGLVIRELELTSENDKLVKIHINQHKSNIIYSSSQELSYIPGHGYMVSGKMEIRYIFQTLYSIRLKYVFD